MIIHFVTKENSYEASLYFYTFPLPIVILIVLILSIFIKKRKYHLILVGILLAIWLGRSFRIHFADDIKETDLEVVFWNASHDRDFEEAFNVNEGIPDILVLVEHGEFIVKEFQQKYPDYNFYRSIRGISVFSRTPLKIINETTSKYKSNFINFESQGINFYVFDVSASMDVPREWELTFVNTLIQETNNTVILGDFNVPYESKYFDAIKTNFNHAFSEKGNGFRETWFWNIPLLSLDHIWVSKDLKVLKTEKIATFKSDHSMVKTYVRK
ncbi:endonuclease/exonuclease/phosphatase family protein [Flavivirga abyssicola]|uniref:endonuclease/exonuclease/phosphatase family protein n=1 Tax=Flavivirga abyssicola TaxID=3063533 RepID=UPI0026E013A5|nr:endonuclease/exonuclease/phosphatase family protein [Flavivirga sp. MEBiC07777]WVK15023.1 endonuclease/exonuclease/phosphatase family protein [Flavivirga sp. MEBiC07777]